MEKIIVFSGHGDWKLGDDGFAKLPAKCSMKFFTMNARTLSDGLGGNIDRGIIEGLEPDQEAGAFKSVPDMRLYPPTGLNIRDPNPANWHILELPGPVPVNNKNIQVKINDAYQGGADLNLMFELLAPAIQQADSVMFLWAACRALGLKPAGGEKLGINTMQR